MDANDAFVNRKIDLYAHLTALRDISDFSKEISQAHEVSETSQGSLSRQQLTESQPKSFDSAEEIQDVSSDAYTPELSNSNSSNESKRRPRDSEVFDSPSQQELSNTVHHNSAVRPSSLSPKDLAILDASDSFLPAPGSPKKRMRKLRSQTAVQADEIEEHVAAPDVSRSRSLR